MLDTMVDPAHQQTVAPGGTEAVAPAGREGAAADAKAPATGEAAPAPLSPNPPEEATAKGIGAEVQDLLTAVPASPIASAAAVGLGLLQASGEPVTPSRPEADTPSGQTKQDTDAVLALLQQLGVPAAALAPQAPQQKQPAQSGEQDNTVSDAAPSAQVPAAGGQSAPALAPDILLTAAPQAPASADTPATPATPAAPAEPAPAAAIAITEQAAAAVAALPRPATPALQPEAARPASAPDTKTAKNAGRTDALLVDPQTDEPQGIAPPADKPVPVTAAERKPDGSPVQRHSPADWHTTFADSLSARSDPLAGQATFTGTAGAPTLVTGSHATIVSDVAATASAAQNNMQLQQPVPLSGVPVLIAGRALAGDKHFDIRLDPPELGRIEVRLKVNREGQISSHLIADRPDTLALLRRDGAGLERALQDAGLKTAGDGLQFSLRDQSGNGQADGRSSPNAQTGKDDASTPIDAVPANYVRYSGRVGGLDIRV